MTTHDTERWICNEGEKFLIQIGIKNHQYILDSSCGVGNYTIPSAVIVVE